MAVTSLQKWNVEEVVGKKMDSGDNSAGKEKNICSI